MEKNFPEIFMKKYLASWTDIFMDFRRIPNIRKKKNLMILIIKNNHFVKTNFTML